MATGKPCNHSFLKFFEVQKLFYKKVFAFSLLYFNYNRRLGLIVVASCDLSNVAENISLEGNLFILNCRIFRNIVSAVAVKVLCENFCIL